MSKLLFLFFLLFIINSFFTFYTIYNIFNLIIFKNKQGYKLHTKMKENNISGG